MDQVEETGGSLLHHRGVRSNFEDASNHTCHRLLVIVAGATGIPSTRAGKTGSLCNSTELLQRHGMEGSVRNQRWQHELIRQLSDVSRGELLQPGIYIQAPSWASHRILMTIFFTGSGWSTARPGMGILRKEDGEKPDASRCDLHALELEQIFRVGGGLHVRHPSNAYPLLSKSTTAHRHVFDELPNPAWLLGLILIHSRKNTLSTDGVSPRARPFKSACSRKSKASSRRWSP